ncbi:MAG: hypothetical protein QOI20_2078 [Acidimicrobiaceae bacterium]|nr:hypothetical protein [Acidimicrobiaceae bacterium]
MLRFVSPAEDDVAPEDELDEADSDAVATSTSTSDDPAPATKRARRTRRTRRRDAATALAALEADPADAGIDGSEQRAGSRRTFLKTLAVAGLGGAVLAELPADPAAAATVGEFFNVTAAPYNADPTGVVDATLAIQSAIDAASATGGCVYFPQGTYKISLQNVPNPPNPTAIIYCLKVYPGVRLVGASRDKSILRLVNNAGASWYSIIMGADVATKTAALATDLTGLTIESLTIDANGPNNVVTTAFSNPATGYDSREVVHVQRGDDIRIENCRFKNIGDSINTLFLCGEAGLSNPLIMRNIVVRGNIFEGVGNTANTTIYHDHSTVYTSSYFATIESNRFISSGNGVRGAIAAIETHGTRAHIVGNDIEGFVYGIVATGVSAVNTEHLLVKDNNVRDANFGIYIAPRAILSGQTGVALQNARIEGNQIIINRDAWWTSRSPACGPQGTVAGILLDPTSDLPARDLQIINNQIRFLPSTNSFSSTDWADAGIVWYRPSTTITDQDMTISDNYIDGAFTAGIYLNSVTKRCDVNGNRIVNPASAATSATSVNSWRYGIIVSSPAAMSYNRINNNVICDDRTTRQILGTIAGIPSGATTNCEALDNVMDIADTTSAALTPFLASSTATYFLRARVPGNWLALTGSYRYGSTVTSENDGKISIQKTAGAGTNWVVLVI